MPLFDDPKILAWLTLAMPWVYALLLASVRVGGLFYALSYMSVRGLPGESKGILVLSLASVLVWISPVVEVSASDFGPRMLIAMGGELVFGLGIGFCVQLGLAAARMAGQIVGVEMGLSFAAVADPLSQSESTVTASLFAAIASQLLIVLQLDHALIRGLAQSLQNVPLGHAGLTTSQTVELVELGAGFFNNALALALPAMGMLFTVKVALAMLSRIAPKLHIFNLSFALTLILGLVFLHRAIPAIGAAVAEQLDYAVRLSVYLAHAVQHGR